MEPKLGIGDENRKAVVELLNKNLADLHVLYIKTRNYHWNVVGPRFHSMHEMFEEEYDALAIAIDDVAERIRALGAKSPGSMKEFAELARLQEETPGHYPSADDMVRNLVQDHEAIIRQLKKDIDECDDKYGDTGTADFLTGLMEDHEKTAWMLRSLLE
ncbi:MAG: Dps family protein [Armatimonadaceae bacterium]